MAVTTKRQADMIEQWAAEDDAARDVVATAQREIQRRKAPTDAGYLPLATKRLKQDIDLISLTSVGLRHTRNHDFHELMNMGNELRIIASCAQTAINNWSVLAVEAGASWKQIGDELGMSKQAAQQRFGGLMRDRPLPL